MVNTDERRAEKILKTKHSEVYSESSWKAFLAGGPYFMKPETIANLYLLFLEKA